MKTTLISSLGGSPQVITETLFADQNSFPDTIHIITTDFLSARESEIYSRIKQFYSAFKTPAPKVHFDVVALANGTKINDIRTAAENTAFANHLTDIVSKVASDPERRIHMSLAGGRKSMSSYALSVMMLFGRQDDRLSHVLVEPAALENEPEFWWPGQPQEAITTRSGDVLSTKTDDCSVTLVPVPFLRLAHLVKPEKGAQNHLKLIDEANERLKPRSIVVDFEARTICCPPEAPVKLNNAQFAIYALMATARKMNWPGAGPEGVDEKTSGYVSRNSIRAQKSFQKEVLITYYEHLRKGSRGASFIDKLRDSSKREAAALAFSQNLSHLRREVQSEDISIAAKRALEPERIWDKSEKGRCGLPIDPAQIQCVNFPDIGKTILPQKD